MKFGKIAGSAKCFIFQYKPFVRSAKSNLGCGAGCGLTETVSERSRNGLGTVSDRPRIGNDVSAVFRKFLPDVMLDGHFAWQAQYLVSLEGDICFCAHWK